MDEYMTIESPLPPYLPYPRFLLGMDLTHTAKLVYSLLLDRATLSQANGWTDNDGRLFLVFPINGIAETINKGVTTTKNALNELETAGLIDRKRCNFAMPNRIYIKLPTVQDIGSMADDKAHLSGLENCLGCSPEFVPMKGNVSGSMTVGTTAEAAGNVPVKEPGNYPSDGQKAENPTASNVATNHLSINHLNNNHQNNSARAFYGRYKNVQLTDEELTELQNEFPAVWKECLEQLSAFMASTGRQYKSHAATIRRWAEAEKAKSMPKQYVPDYSCGEGESL